MTYFSLPISAYTVTNNFLINSYNSRKAFGLTCKSLYSLYRVHEKEFALAELVNFIITHYCIVANSFSGSESLETKLKQAKAILVGENHLDDHHRALFGHLVRLIYSQGKCKLLVEAGKTEVGTRELKYVSKAAAETHDSWEDGKLHSMLWNAIQEGLKKILGAVSSFLIACDASDKKRAIAILESKISFKVIIDKQKNSNSYIARKLLLLAAHILKMYAQHKEEIGAKIRAADPEREEQYANSIEKEPNDVKVVTCSGLNHNKADSKTIVLLKQKNISFISLIPKSEFKTSYEETQSRSQISDMDGAREKLRRFITLNLNEELTKDWEILRRYALWIDLVVSNEIKVLENLLKANSF